MKNVNKQKGFSLLEMLVALAILVIVAGTVIAGMIRMTWSQNTVMNRTQMHSSVRNATELMQQEIGQAGRLATIDGLKITSAALVGSNTSLGLDSTSGLVPGLYNGEQLVVDPNSTFEETVTISNVSTSGKTFDATFANGHAANTPALILGGFASGIVPPLTNSSGATSKIFSGTGTTGTNITSATASDGSTLKLYGDLNGDGNMIYVVYKCSPNSSGTGTLARYSTASGVDITTSTAAPTGTILLDTLSDNPNNAPCFTYFTKDAAVTINGGQPTQTFVVNVAVTLTVQTQNKDLETRAAQTETKALLNVAPRNVFDAWQLASSPAGYTRAQPMPPNILSNLLTASLSTAGN